MNFKEMMQKRYTTKMYDATKKIDKKKIDDLKEILRLSPSSINSQPWKFIFVSDTKTKKKLSEVSRHNQNKILNCDTVVVFNRINNLDLFEKQIKEILPQKALDYYQNYIKPMPEEQIKVWMSRQVYLALGVFLSACAAMDIDATPMEGIDFSGYDEVLNQKEYSTIVAVAIGYRDSEDFNQLDRTPKTRKDIDVVIETI